MFNHKYLLKPDQEDLRDFMFRGTYKRVADLPKSVDLRSMMSPVVSQGNLGSCTANAIASGFREYLEIKAEEPLVRLSRLFLYYEERVLEGTVDEDSGAQIRDGMKVLQKIGVCPESDMPYDISKFTEAPDENDIKDAAEYKITEFHRVANINSLKAALAEGFAVVIGIKVYESFESDATAKTGKVPMPKRGEQVLGGHAALAVGYKDTGKTAGYLIVRNSWGEDWGDKGYFYLTYPVFKKLIMDMWTGK